MRGDGLKAHAYKEEPDALPPLRAVPSPRRAGALEVTHRVLEVKILDPLRERAWDEWVYEHRDATVFHSSAWARVLSETYGHRPCYMRMSAQGQPVALVPMMEVQTLLTRSRGVSLPFSDFCAPLILSSFGSDLIVGKLRQVARERGWSYFEVRDHSILPKGTPASESYYAHTLDLRGGSEALSSRFSSAAQRAIRKAERHGLSATVKTDPEAMDQFYRLHSRTRRKHGVPPQPREFFANIQRHIVNAGLGFIVTVEEKQRPVAAAMFFRFGRHAIYKFGASDHRLQELRGNNLAMSTAIRFLAESGVELLHFGRTEKENDGLRRFKLSWGATEEEIRYGKFDVAKNGWEQPVASGTLHKRIFRALPLSLNRLAGAIIYPHLD